MKKEKGNYLSPIEIYLQNLEGMSPVEKYLLELEKKYLDEKIISNKPTIIKKSIAIDSLLNHPFTDPNDYASKKGSGKSSILKISGIGESNYLKFRKAKIYTVEDIVKAGVKKISRVLGWSEKGAYQIYVRGLSLYQKRVIKIKPLNEISQYPVYLDIETDLFQKKIWMIGMFIAKKNEFIQLIANTPKDESKIIRKCLKVLSEQRNEDIISYSGSRFDERILRKKFEYEKLNHDHIVFRDILLDIKPSLAFPINTYKLIDLANFYGYNFKYPNMDGKEVAFLYHQYSNDLRKFQGYQKLCDYNEDDVKSLVSIVQHLYMNNDDKNKPF